MPNVVASAISAIKGAEIREYIAMRNRPMLTALQMCIDQLEQFQENNPDVQYVIQCARKAVELETGFQKTA